MHRRRDSIHLVRSLATHLAENDKRDSVRRSLGGVLDEVDATLNAAKVQVAEIRARHAAGALTVGDLKTIADFPRGGGPAS